MNVLIDTPIWSLALRRSKQAKETPIQVLQLSELIQEGKAKIIGPIRQEILSGLQHSATYQMLKQRLEAFEDLPILTSHYERAAEMFNLCRKKGIQGSHIDFLICSIAENYQLSIFTLDHDFRRYASAFPLALF